MPRTSPARSVSWDVVGVGANSVDYVYRLPAYPERDGPNAKMRISSHSLSCGGQVATALCTCAAMGLRVKYIGATGTDDNGRRIRDELGYREVVSYEEGLRRTVHWQRTHPPAVLDPAAWNYAAEDEVLRATKHL